MKTTIRNAFDAFRANLQCCAFFSFPFGGPVIFFFERHVDQTVDRLGTRVEFIKTEDLLKKFAWRRQRNLVTVEVFENVSTKRFARSPAWSPVSRWSKMIRAPGTNLTKPTPGQRCKGRLVFDCVCTVTQVSIQMQKRAKVLKIHSQKTDYVFLVNARPFPEQSSSIATCRVGSI